MKCYQIFEKKVVYTTTCPIGFSAKQINSILKALKNDDTKIYKPTSVVFREYDSALGYCDTENFKLYNFGQYVGLNNVELSLFKVVEIDLL